MQDYIGNRIINRFLSKNRALHLTNSGYAVSSANTKTIQFFGDKTKHIIPTGLCNNR